MEIEPKWYVTNREDNNGYNDYYEESIRVDNIGKVFPIIFFIIAALISLTSMTRLVEEHRAQIGTLKALGFSDKNVFLRYLSFSIIPSSIASFLGVLFGGKFFPYTIMGVYEVLYTGNDKYYMPYNWNYGLIAILVSVLSTTIATAIACYKSVRTKPSELMRAKSPADINKSWFEKLHTFKGFGFGVKSAVRNIIRYKKRLIMTLIGIGGCMGLIVVACGLIDSIKVVPTAQFEEIMTYDIATILEDGISDKDEKKVYNFMKKYYSMTDVVKVFGANADIMYGEERVEASMMVPEDNTLFEKCIQFRDRETKKKYHMPDKGAIISEKAAELLGIKEGDKVTIDVYGQKKVEVEIKYISETYLYHYIYMSKNQYKELYGKKLDTNQIFGVYDSSNIRDIYEFNSELGSQLIKYKGVLGTSFGQDMVDETKDMVEALNMVVYVLLISAALLTLVVIYNLNSINITERSSELATLKVIGFYDNEVSNYIYL